jgi:PST family polysaccharide transporter
MGTDFYPRLTAVADDHLQVNRLVNEQTEIGILLALPGLLATLVFSPWIIHLLYTARFVEAANLLPWFVLGIFGRVVSFPLGYIPHAKGAARWFAATETVFSGLHLALVWVGLRWFGLVGVAAAFAVFYAFVTIVVLWGAARLSQFRWSPAVIRLLALASILIAATFALIKLTPPLFGMSSGGLITVATGFYFLRQITARLGPAHRISRMVVRLPWIGQRLAA